MNDQIVREYRKQRATGLPANVALLIARTYTKDFGWEPAGARYDKWTREQDGFHITLTATTESEYAKDNDGMGHYVRTRENYVGHGAPDLDEDTPLNLPAAHFIYATSTRDAYDAFFPDAIEDQYQWARTRGGMSRGVARDYITQWASERVRECCSSDYVYIDMKVTVAKNDVTLATAYYSADFIHVRDAAIFDVIEDADIVGEAITEARAKLTELCA